MLDKAVCVGGRGLLLPTASCLSCIFAYQFVYLSGRSRLLPWNAYILILYVISDIVEKVLKPPNPDQFFRPDLSGLDGATKSGSHVSSGLRDVISSCVAEDPSDRPSAAQALKSLAKINPNK